MLCGMETKSIYMKIFNCPNCKEQMEDDGQFLPDDRGWYSCSKCHILYDALKYRMFHKLKFIYEGSSYQDCYKAWQLKVFI